MVIKPNKIMVLTEDQYNQYKFSEHPDKCLLDLINDRDADDVRFHYGDTMMTVENPEQWGIYKYKWKNGINYALVVTVVSSNMAFVHTLTEINR